MNNVCVVWDLKSKTVVHFFDKIDDPAVFFYKLNGNPDVFVDADASWEGALLRVEGDRLKNEWPDGEWRSENGELFPRMLFSEKMLEDYYIDEKLSVYERSQRKYGIVGKKTTEKFLVTRQGFEEITYFKKAGVKHLTYTMCGNILLKR